MINIRTVLLVCVAGLLGLAGCSRKQQAASDTPYQAAVKAIGGRNYEEAFQKLDEAITQDRGDARDSALAEDYLLRGYLCRVTGMYDSVGAVYTRAIALGHTMGDKNIEKKGKLGLAEFYCEARMFALAEPEASGAATLGVLQSDPGSVVQALALDARALIGLTRYEPAAGVIDSMARLDATTLQNSHALEIMRLRLDLLSEVQPPASVQQLAAAGGAWIEAASALRDTSAITAALMARAAAYEGRGERDSASRSWSAALSMSGFTGEAAAQIECLARIGNIAMETGRMEDARRFYHDALTRATESGTIVMEELLRLQLTGCDWLSRKGTPRDSSRPDEEIERIRQQYATSDSNIGIAAIEGYAQFLRGRMLERRNQPAAALKAYGAALDQFERDGVLRDRRSLPAVMVNAFMRTDRSGWYDSPLALSCAVLDAEGALSLAERRNLADHQEFFSNLIPSAHGAEAEAIASLQLDVHSRRLAQRDLFEEAMHGPGRNNERMFRIQTAGFGGPGDTLSAPAGLTAGWGSLLGVIRPDLKRIQDSLPANAAVVAYVPAQSTLYAIVVRRDTILLRSSAMDRARLESLMDEYRHLSTLSDSVARFSGIATVENRVTTISAILGTAFIGSVKSALDGAATLYVLQTPDIGWLPVHTLQRGEPAAKFTVKYLPYLDILTGAPPSARPVTRISGFGYKGPGNYDVEYELKDIWAFFREAKMYFDTAATMSVLADSSCELLHVCADFQLNVSAPGESRLMIANPSTATAGTAFPAGSFYGGMKPAQTIVFSNVSALSGGLSRYVPALLLANGTQTVAATMWQGDRKAKKYFGEVFYTALTTGVASSEAYHQAMVKMISNPEYASPRLYGVYFLYGK